MSSLLTRRQLAALLSAVPVAAQVATTPPIGAPQPPKPSATPEQRLQKAFSDVRDVSHRLSQIEVPMDLEPAFSFRV
jgi:hypothetical protein